MADNEHPQHRDLTPPPQPPAGPVDPDQYAQFQQFQQFQQFLKYQETQGEGGSAPLQLPPAKKPLWKRILTSWPVRKLGFYLIVLAVIAWAINYYFGSSSSDDGKGVQGGAGPGQQTDPGRPSGSASAAIDTLYRRAAVGDQGTAATTACKSLFNDAGKADFVRDFNGTDCESVIRALAGKVGVLARPPLVDETGKQSVVISSCDDLQLRDGTMGLGKFTISRVSDGWIISGHEPEPNPCPAETSATSTTSTPTTS